MSHVGCAHRVSPTPEEWEARREKITQLYFDEEKTLTAVMADVNEPGIFDATMYKARIRKWGLDKKIKEHEARAILCLHDSLHNKSTPIRLRGRRVDIRRVEHYFQRKGMSINDVLKTPAVNVQDVTVDMPTIATVIRSSSRRSSESSTGQDSDTTATSFEGDEPPASKVVAATVSPQCLSDPDSFMIAESVFADVHQYIMQSFGLGFWVSYGSDEFCRNRKTVAIENGTNPYHNETRVACFLFKNNQPAEAKRHLRQVFRTAKTLVHRQAMRALPYIIESLAILVANGKHQCAIEMLKQLSVAFGLDSSQTTLIFKRIFWMMRPLVGQDGADGFLLATVRSLIGSYEKVLGVSHLQTTETTSVLTRVSDCLYGPVGLDVSLNILYHKMVEQYGAHNVRSLSVLLDIANIQLQCHQYSSAEATAQKSVEGASSLLNSLQTHATISLLCDSHYIVAQAQDKQENIRFSEQNYRKALEISQREWGSNDLDVVGYRTLLWQWLIAQGREQETWELELQGPIDVS
ncbi:MAG: hypothetical protein Q9215_005268 [Flavoplaca cf. flavocitrina]